MKISIKKLKESNFDDFFSLLVDMAKYEDIVPPNNDAKKRLFDDAFCKSPKYFVYLAYHKENIVGFLVLLYTYSTFLALPTLFIEDIFLIKEYRRKGIGQKLFNLTMKIANDNNCGRVEWNTFKWNSAAQSFYEKNGAKKLDNIIYFRMDEEKINNFKEK